MNNIADYTAYYFDGYKVVILVDNCALGVASLTNCIEDVVAKESEKKESNLWEWVIVEKDSMGNYDIVSKKSRYVSWCHLLLPIQANRMSLKKIAEYARFNYSKH